MDGYGQELSRPFGTVFFLRTAIPDAGHGFRNVFFFREKWGVLLFWMGENVDGNR